MNRIVLQRLAVGTLALGVGGCSAGGAGNTPTPPLAVVQQPTAIPTASALPAVAATQPIATGVVYPIFETGGGFVMGGVKDGQWLDTDAVAAAAKDNQMTYRLYSRDGLAGQSEGTLSVPGSPQDPCDFPRVKMDADPLADGIGVPGDWDPAPRVSQSLMPDITTYQDAIADILKKNGIAKPEIFISGTYLVDLEGDGTDEVIISASRLSHSEGDGVTLPGVEAGDYTLLAMRKVVGNEAQTFAFDMTTYPEASDIAYAWRPSIVALLDLNGDGKLEIVVKESAFEGLLFDAYEVNGTELNPVLSGGCSI